MEVSTFSATFCVTLSLILAHCASDVVPWRISDHLQQVDHHFKFRSSETKKLKLEEQPKNSMKSLVDKEVVPHKNYLIKALSGQQINKGHDEKQKNAIMHARKGAWRESEYFTMDYHWVRRRRPIHNQQIPFVP